MKAKRKKVYLFRAFISFVIFVAIVIFAFAALSSARKNTLYNGFEEYGIDYSRGGASNLKNLYGLDSGYTLDCCGDFSYDKADASFSGEYYIFKEGADAAYGAISSSGRTCAAKGGCVLVFGGSKVPETMKKILQSFDGEYRDNL